MRLANICFFILFVPIFLCSCGDGNVKSSFKEDQENFSTSIEKYREFRDIISSSLEMGEYDLTDSLPSMIEKLGEAQNYSEQVSKEYLAFLHPSLTTKYEGYVHAIGVLHHAFLTNDYSQLDKAASEENWEIMEFDDFLIKNRTQIEEKMREVLHKARADMGIWDVIVSSISTDKDSKKSFWGMLIRLMLSVFVFAVGLVLLVIVLTVLGAISIVPVASLLGNRMSWLSNTILFIMFSAMAIIVAAYLLLWGAYCRESVEFYLLNPKVSHPWLYWVFGFSFCTSFLSQRGRISRYESSRWGEETRGVFILGLFVFPLLGFFFYSSDSAFFQYLRFDQIMNWFYPS